MLAGNWVPELVTQAGGESILATSGENSAYFGWDQILDAEPDLAVFAACGFSISRTLRELKTLQASDVWQRLIGTCRKGVYVLDGNAMLNRPGPRLVDSVELLSKLLHGELDDAESKDFQRIG